ncbi:MAG: hypothetical protein WAM66_02525 [Acidobacteriaceae bacterium]
MATQFTEYPAVPLHRAFSWTGIFAGTFLFLAIEATFGILGVAIFEPLGSGISIGLGIWMVVLSIIAFYFAGNLAARLSGATTRNLGMYAGLVTYGMGIFASILITALMLSSTVAGSTAVGFAGPIRIADMLTTGGYWLFAALVLAMISAGSGGMLGASSSGLRVATTRSTTPGEQRAA